MSNVDLKALGWCDLVTKFVLATTVAVPGACLCIVRYLELVSSSRSLPANAKALRNRRLFDAIICYFIPFLYMTLHIVGQDHRFDLVEGIGCVASVHPSPPASAGIWLPHILMCIFSLALSGIAVHNSFRHPSTHFSTHLESRSPMTSRVWSSTLAISMAVTAASFLVVLFSMFALPMSDSWISWQHVHEHLSEVDIVTEKDQISGIRTFWWGLRVVTMCYIVLVLVLGEERRDIFEYLRTGAKKVSLSIPPFITLRPRGKDKGIDYQSSFPPSFDNSFDKPRRPVTLELKSGWDDDLDVKSPGLSRLSPMGWKKGRVSPPTSPSPSPSSKTVDDFMATSMPYLSPTMVNTLGYSTPVVPPPPVYQSAWKKPRKTCSSSDYDASHETRLLPTSPGPSTRPLDVKKKHRPAESRGSNIFTVLQEQWPAPPNAIPSPIPSDMTTASADEADVISPTRASSPALSIDERRQPCSYMASSSRPFDSAFIPSSSPAPEPTPRSIKRSLTRRPSLSSIRSLLGKERAGHGAPGSSDVIHMTVVQETV